MGFEVHTCFKDGSSKVMFLADEISCTCAHHGGNEVDGNLDACCCEPVEQEEFDLCCYTSVNLLNPEQIAAKNIKVESPAIALAFAMPTTHNNLSILNDTPICTFHAANVVHGPDGGIVSITPLRL